MTLVAVDTTAERRLQDLGLEASLLVSTLLRADAEAKLTTALEPPTAEGSVRYFKTVRFLREELVARNWEVDNHRNFCSTIHPGRSHSIAVSSGDEYTGRDIRGASPSTRYPKGDLTELAVRQNAIQEAFDFGGDFDDPVVERTRLTSVWFFLHYTTAEHIYSELSLPTGFENHSISEWEERILLPPISREAPGAAAGPTIGGPDSGDADDDPYSVDITLR